MESEMASSSCIRHKLSGEYLRMGKFDPVTGVPLYGPLEMAWIADTELQAIAQAAFLDDHHEVVCVSGELVMGGADPAASKSSSIVFTVACRVDGVGDYIAVVADEFGRSGAVGQSCEVLKFRFRDDLEEFRDLLDFVEKCVQMANTAGCRGVLEGLNAMKSFAASAQCAASELFMERADKALNAAEGRKTLVIPAGRRGGMREGRPRDVGEVLAIANVFEPYPADDEIDIRAVF